MPHRSTSWCGFWGFVFLGFYGFAFDQPKFIKEQISTTNSADNRKITYLYGTHENRIKSTETETVGGQTRVISTRYYMGDYERVEDEQHTVKHIYYLGGEGLNTIVLYDEANTGPGYQHFYTYTDHLGSILTLTDAQGAIVHEQSFDTWGRDRKPENWGLLPIAAPNAASNFAWLNRGYTGHEHHRAFGIINMNGRLYDPALGRAVARQLHTRRHTRRKQV
jgi:hypothetical protein